jgi:hypothetical protein
MHLVPEGLPAGIPGIAEVMEGAMQQAPQPDLQIIGLLLAFNFYHIHFKPNLNVIQAVKMNFYSL